MSSEIISGWECSVCGRRRDARRVLDGAIVSWSFDDGLNSTARRVPRLPTAVLGWLIKPLLRTAYAEGWADRGGTFNPTQIPSVYVDHDT